jgi:NH3-dependent NAD+ synthetase
MGFSYKDADLVLQGQNEGMERETVEKVQKMVEQNKFKLVVPYVME